MSPIKYYARTDPVKPDRLPHEPDSRWQPLRDHLLNVACLAKDLALRLRPGDDDFAREAEWAGLFHDFGKYTDEFQKMLNQAAKGENRTKVPHSIYGAALAWVDKAYYLAMAIMGHHAGLHNSSDLKEKFSNEIIFTAKELADATGPVISDLNTPAECQPPPLQRGEILVLELRIRMLFSCLVDGDRLDCLRHETGVLPAPEDLQAEKLLDRLLSYIEGRAKSAKVEKVRNARREVLEACLRAAGCRERLLSLAVPTGGGKTLASMAFALKHAALNPKEFRRIIVVIPFLSIIEQNAMVYAEALGPEAVFEHHSGDFGRLKTIPGQKKDEGRFRPTDESEEKINLQMEQRQRHLEQNWDAPIIVTTSVRFFETLFSNHPSDLRRMHNIGRSIVILDEVQTLPKNFLETLLSMMNGLAKEWGTTFLFCTATQPAFEKSPDAPENDMRWEKGTIKPIVMEDKLRKLVEDLKSVKDPDWPQAGEMTPWSEIAEKLVGEKRVLCIVNTKPHAAELYRLVLKHPELPAGESSTGFHLSTRMCAAHRLDKINEIRRILQESNQPCRVVSTQLVEAGVDLDFPVVYRAMGPLDAIVQAAGRCDREGRLTAAAGEPEGLLVVFNPEEDKSPYKQETNITRGLLNRGTLSIHEPKHIRTYFNMVYEGDRDPKLIQGMRQNLSFKDVAKAFAMIDDRTKAVLVPYNQAAKELMARIQKERMITREVFGKIQQYQVGLYPHEFEEARRLGTIIELWENADVWECRPSCYSPDTGLEIKLPDPEDYQF